MKDFGQHCMYLLDLFVYDGPLARHQLDHRFNSLGPQTATRMEQALESLVRSGDVLMNRRPSLFYVAPAHLVPTREAPGTYRLIGHPGANAILRNYGTVHGPRDDGKRHFVTSLSIDELVAQLSQFGITIEEAPL